jgi:hypothetical protein
MSLFSCPMPLWGGLQGAEPATRQNLAGNRLWQGFRGFFKNRSFIEMEAVMNVIKNVLSWAFALALIAMIFSSPQVRADGMPGVRETATEILVDVPKFCHLLETRWTLTLTHATGKDDALDVLLIFNRKEKGHKASVYQLRPDVVEISAAYAGGETIHIPKDKRIKFVGILATGSPEPGRDNWAYVAYGGKVGRILSDPVRRGLWGQCT